MTSLPLLPCYLNGAYSPLSEARVSVMDRGFIFGDGIYEVVPIYEGRPFRFDQHMARMERSLQELRITNPHTRAEWMAIIRELLSRNGNNASETGEYLVYVQITRGVAMRDHVMPADITPTVFAMVNTMHTPSAELRAKGAACVTAEDFRWEKAHIKSTSLLGAVFARQISFDAGALETIMFRDGFLSEAAASNVWIVRNDVVIGPPRDNLVLEGIRYGLMEELCRDAGIGFELRRIPREEVLAADELLLTSATKEVLPVTTLDGRAVGNPAHSGQPGPIAQRLHAAYQRAKQAAAL